MLQKIVITNNIRHIAYRHIDIKFNFTDNTVYYETIMLYIIKVYKLQSKIRNVMIKRDKNKN